MDREALHDVTPVRLKSKGASDRTHLRPCAVKRAPHVVNLVDLQTAGMDAHDGALEGYQRPPADLVAQGSGQGIIFPPVPTVERQIDDEPLDLANAECADEWRVGTRPRVKRRAVV